MAYTPAEQKRIDEKAAYFLNKLCVRFRESGQPLTKHGVDYYKLMTDKAAQTYIEIVDSDEYLKCEELINPATNNTGIKIEEVLASGGQSWIFLANIPHIDAINPLPFYHRMYQHKLRELDDGNLDSVRDIYSQRAKDLIESIFKRSGGRAFLFSELKPLLTYKFRGGKCVLRINKGGEDTSSPKKAARVKAFDGYMHDNLIFSAVSSKTPEQRDFSLLEYFRRAIPSDTICSELSQEEQIRAMIMAAKGLDAFYRLGTVHRDIKPENILISRLASGRLELKIADFGLVRLTERSNPNSGTVTDVGELAGSSQFGSPEHFLIPEEVDVQSDICSLGLTGYYWVTGEHAIRGSNQDDLLENARFRVKKPVRIIDVSNSVRYRGIPVWHLLERKKLGDRYDELEKAIAKMIYTDTNLYYDDKKKLEEMILLIKEVKKEKRFGKDKRYKTPAEVIVNLEKVLAGERADMKDISISEVFE